MGEKENWAIIGNNGSGKTTFMKLILHRFKLDLKHTYRISRRSFDSLQNLVVEINHDGISGYGEATHNPYYENTEIDVTKWDPALEAYKIYMKNPDATTADMGSFAPPTGKDDLAKYRKAQAEARLNFTKLKNDANAKALKIGEGPNAVELARVAVPEHSHPGESA